MDDVVPRPVRLSRRLAREVSWLPSASLALAGIAFSLSACRLEKPDPASQAAAILHKHPSDFQDQLVALDALAAREAAELETGASVPGPGDPRARPASRP